MYEKIAIPSEFGNMSLTKSIEYQKSECNWQDNRAQYGGFVEPSDTKLPESSNRMVCHQLWPHTMGFQGSLNCTQRSIRPLAKDAIHAAVCQIHNA